jgi:hypothetical protein
MRRRPARAAAALALLWLAGCASVGGSRSVTLAKPVREVLPNGVVLIAQGHRAMDVVALQLGMRSSTLRAGVELLADLATHASFPLIEIENE